MDQIISRTALFASEHGGQSEIVLRVKQGDNPTFGFLMPDHHLNVYYRFLVEHPQLIKTDKTREKEKLEDRDNKSLAAPGGASTLLGSVYGLGEDDDDIQPSDDKVIGLVSSCTTATLLPPIKVNQHETSISNGLGDKKTVKHSPPVAISKEKTISIKNNLSVNLSLINGSQKKKTKDAKTSSRNANATISNDKASIFEPPFSMNKVVDLVRINGKVRHRLRLQPHRALPQRQHQRRHGDED